MAELLGGPVAQEICENIIDRLEKAKKSDKYPGRLPKLAIVRVGKREDDLAYERGAVKRTEKVGMDCETFEFDTDITNEEFQKEFIKINSDNDIDGILLFMPLPKHINTQEAIANFCPDKDLDGLTLGNMAALYAGTDGYAPCTAEAVIKLLEYSDIDVDGKNVTVIGRSNVIGKPVSMMLIDKNATVTVCHSHTKNLKDICQRAEILVAAIGRAKMIDDSYISDGTVVIDVGVNVDEDGNLCGDTDFESVSKKASLITPVPRGVGNITTSVLSEHLLRSYLKKFDIQI